MQTPTTHTTPTDVVYAHQDITDSYDCYRNFHKYWRPALSIFLSKLIGEFVSNIVEDKIISDLAGKVKKIEDSGQPLPKKNIFRQMKGTNAVYFAENINSENIARAKQNAKKEMIASAIRVALIVPILITTVGLTILGAVAGTLIAGPAGGVIFGCVGVCASSLTWYVIDKKSARNTYDFVLTAEMYFSAATLDIIGVIGSIGGRLLMEGFTRCRPNPQETWVDRWAEDLTPQCNRPGASSHVVLETSS